MFSKVLVIGTDITGKSVERAFVNCGYSCKSFFYPQWRKYQIPQLRRFFLKWKRERDFNLIIQKNLRNEVHWADLIIFIKGERLDEKSKALLKGINKPMVLWTIDSLSRYPYQADILPFCEYAFFHDNGDVKQSNSEWLPLGYDKGFYQPYSPKEYDIVFAGTVNQSNYSNRYHYLKLLLNSDICNKYKIAIAANLNTNDISRIKRIRNIIYFGRLTLDEYSKVISKGKICINILQDDGDMPVNPLFFAIPGTKTCQITEDRAHLHNWLKINEHYIAVNRDNFIKTLSNLLEDEQDISLISETGYRFVLEMHTLEARCSRIVSKIEQVLNNKK